MKLLPIVPGQKHCRECDKILPLAEFYINKLPPHRSSSYCKPCMQARSRSYGTSERGRDIRAINRRNRPMTERERRRRQEKRNALRARYPDRDKARSAVAQEIKMGRISRQSCEVCGEDNAQAHHHDYSKPLDVQWLCRICHLKEHGMYRTIGDFSHERETEKVREKA